MLHFHAADGKWVPPSSPVGIYLGCTDEKINNLYNYFLSCVSEIDNIDSFHTFELLKSSIYKIDYNKLNKDYTYFIMKLMLDKPKLSACSSGNSSKHQKNEWSQIHVLP